MPGQRGWMPCLNGPSGRSARYTGRVISKLRRNASALPPSSGSSTDTRITSTPWAFRFRARLCSMGTSSRHGPHQLAQALTIAALAPDARIPARSAVALMVCSVVPGAALVAADAMLAGADVAGSVLDAGAEALGRAEPAKPS